MLLTVVLIVLTTILGIMSIGVFLWWKKYGREMFSIMKKMNNMTQNQNFNPNSDILKNLMDISNQIMKKNR
jgi:hypothetical protein